MFRKTLPLVKTAVRASSSSNAYFAALFPNGSTTAQEDKSKKTLEKATLRMEAARRHFIQAAADFKSAEKVVGLFKAHQQEKAQLTFLANDFKKHFLQGLLGAVKENKTYFSIEFYGKDFSVLFSQFEPFLQQCGFNIHGNAYVNEKNETINRYHTTRMNADQLSKITFSKTDELNEPTPDFLKNFKLEINNRLEEGKKQMENPGVITLSRSLTGC